MEHREKLAHSYHQHRTQQRVRQIQGAAAIRTAFCPPSHRWTNTVSISRSRIKAENGLEVPVGRLWSPQARVWSAPNRACDRGAGWRLPGFPNRCALPRRQPRLPGAAPAGAPGRASLWLSRRGCRSGSHKRSRSRELEEDHRAPQRRLHVALATPAPLCTQRPVAVVTHTAGWGRLSALGSRELPLVSEIYPHTSVHRLEGKHHEVLVGKNVSAICHMETVEI